MKGAAPFALCLLCALGAAARAAAAGTGSVSYSTWIVSPDSVMLRFLLPAAAAQPLAGTGMPQLAQSRLEDYVLAHTEVWAAGRECPASDQGYDLGKVDPLDVGAGLYGFEIVFRCAGPVSALSLHDHVLFGQVPAHVDFARIEVNGHFTEQLFTAGHERLQIKTIGAVPAAGLLQYARLGLMHVLHSPDLLGFLLAALLLVRHRRDLGRIVLGVAAGYGLSLSAQATGLIQPQMTALGGFIGLLVAVLAMALILPQLRWRGLAAAAWPVLLALLAIAAALLHAPQPALLLTGAALFSAGFLNLAVRSGPRGLLFWLLPAAVYGFLDGFVLPATLAPLQFAPHTGMLLALGYDLGSLLMAAGLLALPAGVFAFIRNRQLLASRAVLDDVAAACLGGLGTFWLLSALHS